MTQCINKYQDVVDTVLRRFKGVILSNVDVNVDATQATKLVIESEADIQQYKLNKIYDHVYNKKGLAMVIVDSKRILFDSDRLDPAFANKMIVIDTSR
jgi:esterase/lipase